MRDLQNDIHVDLDALRAGDQKAQEDLYMLLRKFDSYAHNLNRYKHYRDVIHDSWVNTIEYLQRPDVKDVPNIPGLCKTIVHHTALRIHGQANGQQAKHVSIDKANRTNELNFHATPHSAHSDVFFQQYLTVLYKVLDDMEHIAPRRSRSLRPDPPTYRLKWVMGARIWRGVIAGQEDEEIRQTLGLKLTPYRLFKDRGKKIIIEQCRKKLLTKPFPKAWTPESEGNNASYTSSKQQQAA